MPILEVNNWTQKCRCICLSKKKKAFRDAFITEIGQPDYEQRLITFRELVDVIVCAGKDVTPDDLKGLWNYGTHKEEISYQEAYHIFTQIPATDFDALYNSFNALTNSDGKLDWNRIIEYAKEQQTFHTKSEDLKDALDWLKDKKKQNEQIENMVYNIHNCQTELKDLNARILEDQKRSLPVYCFCTSQETGTEDKTVSLKSLVIQKSSTQSTCVAYSFSLDRSQRVRINIQINEKIDSSLNRFNNSILGYIVSDRDSTKILALTRRKEGSTMYLDWVKLGSGTYTLIIKFCRPLKMVEPEKSEEILDDKRKLTKPFKVIRAEFEAYSILSGSGKVLEEKWQKICQNFELRNSCLSMRTFLEMHQVEAESYGPRGILRDMWLAVRELGHNKKFFMSTACPLLVDFMFSVDYFWNNAVPLPYLKDLHYLRQFKTEYYTILLAGKINRVMHYKLDLSMSNSVNIEGNDLIIDQIVPANTTKVLTVAIAQAEPNSWFLNVKFIEGIVDAPE
uniref:Uncharacterized protein n=1 Tax=Ditylenchus dipsaci TaxID=166011 RepID=A0A915CXY8_9BILA